MALGLAIVLKDYSAGFGSALTWVNAIRIRTRQTGPK